MNLLKAVLTNGPDTTLIGGSQGSMIPATIKQDEEGAAILSALGREVSGSLEYQ
jgi:hypothetical protein